VRIKICNDCGSLPTSRAPRPRPRSMWSARRGPRRPPPSHAPGLRSLTFLRLRGTEFRRRAEGGFGLRESTMRAAEVGPVPLTATEAPTGRSREKSFGHRRPRPHCDRDPARLTLMPPLCRGATIDIDRLRNSGLPLRLRPRRRRGESESVERVAKGKIASQARTFRSRLRRWQIGKWSGRCESHCLATSDVRARPRLPRSLSGVRLRLRTHLRELS
jgi:hypothetical protein